MVVDLSISIERPDTVGEMNHGAFYQYSDIIRNIVNDFIAPEI